MKKSDIPTNADLFTIEEFLSHVECGGFVSSDGFGCYATKDYMSWDDIFNFRKKEHKPEFTHVVWFNN